MKNCKVVVISVASTIAIIIIIIFIAAAIQSGVIEVIEEDLTDKYCSSIPMNEARDLEVCNE